jgi:hypothetical protein
LKIYCSIRGCDEQFIGLTIGAVCNCVPVIAWVSYSYMGGAVLIGSIHEDVKEIRKFETCK